MLTDQTLPAAKRLTVLSSCCGVTGEAVLTDSAVILLYATSLYAGDAFALLTTAILPLLNGLLIIPMAGAVRFWSCRTLVLRSNLFALAGYLMAVCAAFFPGRAAVMALLGGIMLFAVCQTGFVSAWLPFLDMFLPAGDRTGFLGVMRFFHQLSAICFLGAVGLLIGKSPRIEILQLVLAAGAAVFAGRIWFISRIHCKGMKEPEYPDFLHGLKTALSNQDVMKFSLYTFILNIASGAVIPLTLLDLKNQRHLADNLLIVFSILIFIGMMLGYILVPEIEKKAGRYGTLSILHVLILFSIAGILLAGNTVCGLFGTAFFLMLCNSCIAANSVVACSEIMQRAACGSKMMAMALWGAFFYGGSGISRLAAGWCSSSMTLNRYSLLFAGMLTCIGLFFLRLVRVSHAAGKSRNYRNGRRACSAD